MNGINHGPWIPTFNQNDAFDTILLWMIFYKISFWYLLSCIVLLYILTICLTAIIVRFFSSHHSYTDTSLVHEYLKPIKILRFESCSIFVLSSSVASWDQGRFLIIIRNTYSMHMLNFFRSWFSHQIHFLQVFCNKSKLKCDSTQRIN